MIIAVSLYIMQIFSRSQGALVCFWLSVLFVVLAGFCYGDHSTVEVVGLGECADCKENNIKTSQAFSGSTLSHIYIYIVHYA